MSDNIDHYRAARRQRIAEEWADKLAQWICYLLVGHVFFLAVWLAVKWFT